ncbi:acyltransferase family protein [Akkermansia muciniphila]|uniref:acyltransferase family protein n=1 Tax=Akkermansia muciniphila TaxID=239935 RepID=UPI001C05F47D|nr:acyltransferase family protein [Akkermansia muciniphila]QWP58126.1 acyltransferase family protein [Akkermansia muciniphila]
MNLPSSRIPWLDNIRVFACILVIASHIVGQFFVSPPFTPDNETFAWSSFYTVLVRVSIPLFFMISGALLLPVRDTTGQFLKKTLHPRPVPLPAVVCVLHCFSVEL